MEANKGDVIKWDLDGDEYYSEVSMVEDEHYGVYVVYDNYGFTQDLIPKKDVLAVYKIKGVEK